MVEVATELRAVAETTTAETDGFKGGEELQGAENCEIGREIDESRQDGALGIDVVVKKRRGRPPKAQAKQVADAAAATNDEEDVCFICFDGGSLVLCDRRGCPKAYHPACIKRDEAFFQSAAKWNCGWHICSTCQKSSQYMCYTCTFSLCKGCTKGADFFSVRGNKGFCPTCLNMVKLIEASDQGNREMVQVDFDDKTSWEYLFKVYWIYLKNKLSLTFDELTKATKLDVSASLARKSRISDDLYANNHSDSDYYGEGQAIPNSKRRKTRRWSMVTHKDAPQNEEKVVAHNLSSLPNQTEWASKELLEFVAHMKKGDTSSLTPFDAQSLILQYIKNNDLRDPNCQSQIICDSRLINLFGKTRVGHIEMLKLIEYHFLQDGHAEKTAHIGNYNTNNNKVDAAADETDDNGLMGKDKRQRHKRDRNGGLQTSPDGYAAIDVHNINLIYLPFHLMEKLLADDKFHEKTVGSVVRIKMSSSDEKQDMYRLVQVVGTIKATESYKVGNTLADWKLGILNISKKEVISINEISDQEFTEDECKRFRQSIKYGLATRFKVGEVLEKAMALRTVKVLNFIEKETLRLNYLRDRANEKGQNKEFKEYVEKIELLASPQERQQLHNEVPEVHEDPYMDPRHQTEEDSRLSFHKKHGDSTGAKQFGSKRKGCNSANMPQNGSVTKKNDSGTTKDDYKQNVQASASKFPGTEDFSGIHEISVGPTGYQEKNAYASNGRKKREHSHSPIKSKNTSTNTAKKEVVKETVNGPSREPPPAGMSPYVGDVETEKIWYYQDPGWNIQGPFSMLQLRKWNTSGYFPLDLRIWRAGEKQDESILLTDALEGNVCKKPRLVYNTCEISIQSNASSEFVRSSCSSSLSTPAEIVVNSQEGQCQESLKSHESLSNYSQLSSSQSTQTLACEALSLLAQERHNVTDQRYADPDSTKPSSPVPNLNIESQLAGHKQVNLLLQSHREDIRNDAVENKQCVPAKIRCPDSCPCLISETAQMNPQFSIAQLNSCSITTECQPVKTNETGSFGASLQLKSSQVYPHFPVDAQHAIHIAKPSQSTNNQVLIGSNIPNPDSVSGWTGGSCLGNTSRESSVMPSEQNVWDLNSAVRPVRKSDELVVDVVAAQPTADGEYDVPSPFQFWHSIFGEDDEIPFADESVSDLLAEVDAMECLNGPASPTSAMMRGMEFSQTSKEDGFATDGDLNVTLNLRKGDAFNISGNSQIPCQPTVRVNDQPNGRLETG